MKTPKSPASRSHPNFTITFSVALIANFAAPSALAATKTWVGGYGTTGTWNQSSQWSEGAFANGDDLIFNNNAGSSSTSTFLSTGRTVKSITFNGGTPSPAFNIRLATSGSGGTSSTLTFLSSNTGITVASTDTASHTIGQSDGNVALLGNLTVNHNGSGTLTMDRQITGAFKLTKTGTGTMVISAANNYTGDTTISGGTLRCGVGGNSASSKVILAATSATHSVSVSNPANTWTCSSLVPSATGIMEFKFGAVTPSTTVSPLNITGLADFNTATPTVSVNVTTGLVAGTYPLMTWGSTAGTAPTSVTLSTLAANTAASLSVSGSTLSLVITSTDPYVVKADNASNLNLTTSWVGGAAPAISDIAKWTSAVTSANTTVLGADVTWAGIAIENPGGPVTIDAGSTLTLGAATVDIDMNAATADLTLNCPLALGAANSWNVATSRTFSLGGQISGAFGVTKLGVGTAILSSSANNYTGTTAVSAGKLQLGASNVIPNGASTGNVSVAGTLDLNGNSETVNGLSGAGSIDNTAAATTSTLTVGSNDQTSTFSGILKNTGSGASLNLIKTDTGTLTLSGANTFTGSVTVSSATLVLSHINALKYVNGITLADGTILQADLDLSVIPAPIALGGAGTSAKITAPNLPADNVAATTPKTAAYNGKISGAGNLTLAGVNGYNQYGTISLGAQSDYTGSTLITTVSAYAGTAPNNANIFVKLTTSNALPVTTVLTLDGGDGGGSAPGRYCEFDLNGRNQTLAGLTNVTGRTLRVQQVNNGSATTATLTVNNVADCTYSGLIGAGGTNLGLTKSGVGTFTLAGANTYSGATTVSAGTLALGASNVLPTTAVSIGNATLNAATFNDTVGTLDATATATVNLGVGAALAFADSSLIDWTGGTLNLTGNFISGASLRFGNSNAGLTSTQLALISATGFSGFGLNSNGYLTASVAAGYSSWITGTFANGAVPALQQGANDDPDSDGISNLVEYAVAAQDPTVANAAVGTYAANVLSYTKRTGTNGLTYAIQESTDLGVADVWADVTPTVNNATTISYTLPLGPTKDFIRLKVLSN
jgi:autotransporter-associated beta strand protein